LTSRIYKISSLSFLLTFGIIIFLPLLNGYFNLFNDTNLNENRKKKSKPDFDLSNLDGYVKKFDAYYSDNFSLRNLAIKAHNNIEFNLFGLSPVPREVIVGKNGWFYDEDNLPNFIGNNAFTENELIQIKNELVHRTSWAKRNNVNYYLILVPTKMNVYPEFLPPQIVQTSTITRYNQLIALNNIDGLNIVDLKKGFLEHKNDGYKLYQKTDGHWNDLGAYYAYEQIARVLGKEYKELVAKGIDQYNIYIEKRKGGALVDMISQQKNYPEYYVSVKSKTTTTAEDGLKRGYKPTEVNYKEEFEIVKINKNGANLKCLIIRDSFTMWLIPYLQEHFKEMVVIHDEWKYRMREDIILKEKPDIVLNIMLEINLHKLIEYPFVEPGL